MRLERLTLSDFRNFQGPDPEFGQEVTGSEVDPYEDRKPVTIELGPRFTVLFGHNGAGKTNALEAIYFVSTLRSFRTSDLRAMLRRGRDRARVEILGYDEDLEIRTRLEVRIDRGARSTRRSARLDGKLVRAAADFYGRVSAVLFTPEDLGVLRGSPGGRRRFLDRVAFARERAHIGDVQTYEKLLRSRNRVLKDERLSGSERSRMIDAYDHGLADVGARLWSRRAAIVEELVTPFCAGFAHIHDREHQEARRDLHDLTAGLSYASRLDPEGSVDPSSRRAALSEALANHRKRDEAAGRTTVGPHLDDLEFTLDGVLAGDFASQGQARALVLAFKIAELRSARERSGRAPLLLLDDVSSELDRARSVRLFETLAAEVGQCVLTTTAAGYIELGGGIERRDLEVRDGRITPVER